MRQRERIRQEVRADSQRGFTLLELIISVTLVAMMAVILWSVFGITISSWRRGTAFIDVNQRHRTILDLVKKQMASTYGVIETADVQTPGSAYPVFTGAPESMQFVSLSSLRFFENPGLTMVSYDLVRDGEGQLTLVEREEQYLGLDPARESIFDRKDEVTVPIFENLVSFHFEYYDPGTQVVPARWVNEWDSKGLGRMPVAVSLTMVSQDRAGGTFSRQMIVPIQAKPYDARLSFVNPLESNRPRRPNEDDPRSNR